MAQLIDRHKRILAILCTVLIAAAQVILIWPETSFGEAGESLEVRVQYFGERGDKLRTKATFTKAELETMGADTYCYSNVTDVGTVMVMKAYGPQVTSILDAAGIDIGSVQNVTFRTTDGYTRNFSAAQITAVKNYYPLLNLYTMVPPEDPEEEGEAVDPDYRRFLAGLNLTKVMLLPQYQDEKDVVLDGLRVYEDIAFPDSMGRTFYAIPDGSYLFIDSGREELRGEAYMIRDGVLSRIAPEGGITRLN